MLCADSCDFFVCLQHGFERIAFGLLIGFGIVVLSDGDLWSVIQVILLIACAASFFRAMRL